MNHERVIKYRSEIISYCILIRQNTWWLNDINFIYKNTMMLSKLNMTFTEEHIDFLRSI